MATTVLVIDNDSQVRRFVCAALEMAGYVAVGVGTYGDAIQQLRWSPADLAVSDGFTADGLSGISALHRQFPDLKIIVISGSVVSTRPLQLPPHVSHVVSKPCSVRTLLEAVQKTLMQNYDPHLKTIIERGWMDVYATFMLSDNA